MQISELNTTIDSALRDYDRFSIERQRSKENLAGRRLSKSTANPLNYMDFQFNDSPPKKPAISSFGSNLTSNLSAAHRNDLKSDASFSGYAMADAFQLNKMHSKELPKHGPLSASSQINSNCEKLSNNLSNLTFSARNSYEPTACPRNQPPFGVYSGSCLSSSNESGASLPNGALAGTNGVMSGNLGFAAASSEHDNEKSIKTKEFKKNLVSTADSESKDNGNSFYCLSNLINTPNENPISRFVCLWQDCSKTFTLQRDLVSVACCLAPL